MIRIYEYLGVSHFEHDFDNIQQITVEDDEVYGIYGDHKIKNVLELPPSTAKKTLGYTYNQNGEPILVTDWVFAKYRWFFDRFNYKK
jgi:sulfotransferase